MAYEKLTERDYHRIGTNVGLEGKRLEDYRNFMLKAFPNQFDPSYSKEWANRFKKGYEWGHSDSIRRKVLSAQNKQYRDKKYWK